MRSASRRDANHSEITNAFRGLGASVLDCSLVGRGVPDLIVGIAGKTMLVEIKNPKTRYGKKDASERQSEWRNDWMGEPVYVVRTVEEVCDLIRAVTEVRALDAHPPTPLRTSVNTPAKEEPEEFARIVDGAGDK